MRLRAAVEAAVAVDDESERALSITQFCFVENISKATFYKLKRQGLAPELTYVPIAGVSLIRISPAARRKWHAMLKALQASKAGVLEAARRSAQCREAGRISAASPLHVSRRKPPVYRRKPPIPKRRRREALHP
jgi:hypothetical protein